MLIIVVILGALVPTLIAQQLFEPDLTADDTHLPGAAQCAGGARRSSIARRRLPRRASSSTTWTPTACTPHSSCCGPRPPISLRCASALASSAWSTAEDLHPQKLRVYREVDPALGDALGPSVERLAQTLLRVAIVMSQPVTGADTVEA